MKMVCLTAITMCCAIGCSTLPDNPRDLSTYSQTPPIFVGMTEGGVMGGVDVSEPRSIGANLKAFYQNNRTPLNVAGFVLGSFGVYQAGVVNGIWGGDGGEPAKPKTQLGIDLGDGADGNTIILNINYGDYVRDTAKSDHSIHGE